MEVPVTQTAAPERPAETTERLAVVDTDVHPTLLPTDEAIAKHLSQRWRDYLAMIGIRDYSTERTLPPQRKFTHRTDTVDDSGRPSTIPSFTRGQLLDEFDMSGAILNDTQGIMFLKGNTNFPVQFMMELCRAYNDAHRELWMADDPRFYASINIPVEDPAEAVREIERCREGDLGHRFVQVMAESRTEYPIGNPKYWPIFEACEHYGIPFAVHTSPGRRMTASGGISFYYEWHTGIALRNYTMAPSMIFEGVFDRFPGLNFALIEQGWSWAVPFAWRMDASWRKLRDEVPNLERKPSEYLSEHFYFGSQPMVEPERKKELKNLLGQFEEFFGPDHLMFSSDYPHWDFDSPYEAMPSNLPIDRRRKILGENASKLYNIPLLEGTGLLPSNPAA